MAVRIILASASPRRRALLEALGLHVEVMVSDAPEDAEGKPADVAVAHAVTKRDAVIARIGAGGLNADRAIVIAADTIVVVEGEILGKPRDLDEAHAMVARLSGRSHEVITGLALADLGGGRALEGLERTRVVFRALTADEISRFVHAVRPLDRAGAYTVDGPGSLLVERYEGCFYNVLGLPLVRLDRLMQQFDLSLFRLMDAERSVFL